MKNQPLTVVMYHYVRELKESRYPSIKGLDKSLFINQLNHIEQNYNVVTMQDVIDATSGTQTLPDNAALLTFDDGYVDHHQTVFPLLKERGMQGSFFAPIKAITEHIVLDVNKIHFILAANNGVEKLLKTITSLLDKYRRQYNLQSYDNYYSKLAIANRFDSKDVIFIKRLLQVELPLEMRQLIVDEIFCDTVACDQAAFARQLYMSGQQIREMQEAGMHIGSHSYDHFWLSSLSKSEQELQIRLSLSFLESIGVDTKNWTMCYPYGDFNQNTLSLLGQYGCKIGLTTAVGVATIGADNPLTLPRLDTNDLPQ